MSNPLPSRPPPPPRNRQQQQQQQQPQQQLPLLLRHLLCTSRSLLPPTEAYSGITQVVSVPGTTVPQRSRHKETCRYGNSRWGRFKALTWENRSQQTHLLLIHYLLASYSWAHLSVWHQAWSIKPRCQSPTSCFSRLHPALHLPLRRLRPVASLPSPLLQNLQELD